MVAVIMGLKGTAATAPVALPSQNSVQTPAALINILDLKAPALDKQWQVNQLLQLGVLNLFHPAGLLQDDVHHLWDLAQAVIYVITLSA